MLNISCLFLGPQTLPQGPGPGTRRVPPALLLSDPVRRRTGSGASGVPGVCFQKVSPRGFSSQGLRPRGPLLRGSPAVRSRPSTDGIWGGEPLDEEDSLWEESEPIPHISYSSYIAGIRVIQSAPWQERFFVQNGEPDAPKLVALRPGLHQAQLVPRTEAMTIGPKSTDRWW